MEEDILESLENCDNTNNVLIDDGNIGNKLLMKKRQVEDDNQHDDTESLYADSEFAEAIAKAADTSTSSKLKSSDISKPNQKGNPKRKRPEGVIRPSFRNLPRGCRLAPIPDDTQVSCE